MQLPVLYFISILLAGGFLVSNPKVEKRVDDCKEAFEFIYGEFEVNNQVEICFDSAGIPERYKSSVNMPVCDDTLCANVVLKIYWDLAGNYQSFDTLTGFPLTKFDHKKFSSDDYTKLDQILKNRNSMLRILKMTDLLDKSVKVQSKKVDAVTGATPVTIRKSIVEGAVYSSYTLWHFVNGSIKNQISNFTLDNYSEEVSRRMLLSDNYETQLFALKYFSEVDYEIQSELIFQVITQSVPLVKANTIIKMPLPFEESFKNYKLLSLFPELDNYSKSIFINRVLTERNVAEEFLPLILNHPDAFSKKQLDQINSAFTKFEISKKKN